MGGFSGTTAAYSPGATMHPMMMHPSGGYQTVMMPPQVYAASPGMHQ